MDNKALFVRFTADAGHEGDVSDFLRDALGPVEAEPDTRDWYAIRFNPTDYAVVDTFPDNLARLKHLFGKVGRALPTKTFTILDGPPGINPAEVLASKPLSKGATPHLALHVPLTARSGQEDAVERFLIDAKPLIAAETGTLAWYALKLGSNNFAIVDFFADEAGRAAHKSGSVAGALMTRAAELFQAEPTIRPGEVLACKNGARSVKRDKMAMVSRAKPAGISPAWAAGLAIGAVTAALLIGKRASPSPDHPRTRRWYRQLAKPDFTPPSAVYPIAWTGIQASLAYGGYRLMRAEPSPQRTIALGFWGANQVGIGGWSEIFFGSRAPGWATVASAALGASAVGYVASSSRVDPPASRLGVPLVAWVAFATLLSEEIWRKNDSTAA